MLAAFAIGWPDERLTDLICKAADPMGVQDNVGIYKTKITNPTLTFQDLIPLNQKLRDDLSFRAPPPPEQAGAIWKSPP